MTTRSEDSVITGGAARFLNHVLAGEAWARERLAPFAGRSIRFVLPPLPDLCLVIRTEGDVALAAPDTSADLTVRIPPSSLPRIAARDETGMGAVQVEGDTDLGQVVRLLALNLRWDAEEDLSRLVGDVAAHRIGQAGRDFVAWQRETAIRVAGSAAEYWTEEAALLARKADLEAFGGEVDRLRDDLERLAKRIEKLAAGRPARPGPGTSDG